MLVALVVTVRLMSASAPTQTPTAFDATIRALWTEGNDRSQLYSLAQTLMDEIGPRVTGSPEHKRATDWATTTFERWGIPARAENYGTWKSWRRGIGHFDLIAPRTRSLRGMLLTWSAGIGGVAEGPAMVFPKVDSAAAFERVLPEFRGKFVLLSYAEPTCRPDSSWKEFSTTASFERMQKERGAARNAWYVGVRQSGVRGAELIRRLQQAGALGVVTALVSPANPTAGWGVSKIGSAVVAGMPEIGLSCEDYGLVFRLAANNQGPVLRVNADAPSLGEIPVANVIAELRGSEPAEYVVLSAHLDSWDAASGATDNGASAVAVMEAMRILKAVVPKPKRTILAGLWSGEEQGFNGSRAFAEDHPEVVAGAQVIFDDDNGTGRINAASLQGFTGTAALLRNWLLRIPDGLVGPINLVDPGTPSRGIDAFSFACRGVPAVSLSSVGWDYETYTWHTDLDTSDKIVIDDLRNNAVLLAMAAYLAAEDPARVPREARITMKDGTSTSSWPPCSSAARSSR